MHDDETKICPMLQIMDKCVIRHKKSQQFNNHPIVEMEGITEEEKAIDLSPSQREVYNMLFTIAKTQYEAYKKAGLLNKCYLTVNSFMMPLRKCCSGGEVEVGMIQEKLDQIKSGINLLNHSLVRGNGRYLANPVQHSVTEEEAFNADGECPICLEVVEEPLQTLCRHVFCGDCIRPLIKQRGNSCPLCREPTKIQDLKRPKGAETSVPSEKPESSLKKIMFDAKLQFLVSEIESIKRTNPDQKSLVFTTWSSTMK